MHSPISARQQPAARAFVLPFVTLYDIGIGCWEAKYAYWAIRPFQLDPDVKPLFATPNHPSYPAGQVLPEGRRQHGAKLNAVQIDRRADSRMVAAAR
jgi:hypothetical protein